MPLIRKMMGEVFSYVDIYVPKLLLQGLFTLYLIGNK